MELKVYLPLISQCYPDLLTIAETGFCKSAGIIRIQANLIHLYRALNNGHGHKAAFTEAYKFQLKTCNSIYLSINVYIPKENNRNKNNKHTQ